MSRSAGTGRLHTPSPLQTSREAAAETSDVETTDRTGSGAAQLSPQPPACCARWLFPAATERLLRHPGYFRLPKFILL